MTPVRHRRSFAALAAVLAVVLVAATATAGTTPAPPSAKPRSESSAPPIQAGRGHAKNLDVEKAVQLLAEEKALTILDVRTPEEHAEGRLAGATNLDFNAPDFEDRLARLDRDEPYLVHCAVGGRSAKARDLMVKLGFARVYHLDGGVQAWVAAGQPVEKP